MIVAFTGPRPQKIGGFDIPNPTYNFIIKELEKALKELKPDKAISGMALGVDTFAAELCIKLGIPFIAAVPFKGQESIWPQKSKDHYFELLGKAKEIVYVCDPGYAAWKMQKRNEWMVNHCDILIGLDPGTAGGTRNCLKFAESVNKKVYLINVENI